MRTVLALATALLTGCALPRPFGEAVAFHTLAEAGGRVIDHEDLDGHAVYALEFATLEAATGWGYETGWTVASEDEGGARDLEAEFDEIHFGLRRTFVDPERTGRPYLAFGGAITRLERELHAPDVQVEDEGGAAYLRAGILWNVGLIPADRNNDLLMGFDLKAMVGDDYDALQFALVLGAGR